MKRFAFATFLLLCLPCFGEIKAVIFDHGGVMVTLNHEMIRECLEERMNIHQGPLAGHTRKLASMGLVDEGEFWDEVAGGALPDDWEVHFRQAYSEATRSIPGMRWLVQHLGRRGYRTALLSNVLPSAAAVHSDARHYRYFDPVVLSCEVGMLKPDAEIYHYTLGLLEVEPEECIFIDDKLENVEAARELGIDAIHFQNYEHLCRELQERGILRP